MRYADQPERHYVSRAEHPHCRRRNRSYVRGIQRGHHAFALPRLAPLEAERVKDVAFARGRHEVGLPTQPLLAGQRDRVRDIRNPSPTPITVDLPEV